MIERIEVSDVFAENTYFYIDPESRQGFLIDPGAEPQKLYDIIEHFAFKILQILKAATASFPLKGVAFRLIRRWASAYTRPPEQI